MSFNMLRYSLQGDRIHHWLVTGPLAVPVADLERFVGDDYKLQIARHYYQIGSGVTQPIAERLPFETSDSGLMWRYVRCQDDHFVDLSAFYHLTHYLRSWAYTQVIAAEAWQGEWVLTTNGPADVWVNGQHVHRQEHFHHQIPHRVSFQAGLIAGKNEILVRMEEVAARECPYTMALQIVHLPQTAYIEIPTTFEMTERRQRLEEVFEAAYLDRDLYGPHDPIVVHWAGDWQGQTMVGVRLQVPTATGARIYAEGQPSVLPGSHCEISQGAMVPPGKYDIRLMPTPREYYEAQLRFQRDMPIETTYQTFSTSLYGDYAQRRYEALHHAADIGVNVFSEIAKMELGRWGDVKPEVIAQAIDDIEHRRDCSDFYLVGLLGMMYRYIDKFMFPKELREPLKQCVLNFRYWMDEPGQDAMCFWSENHQILFHTCEVLAGQLYPDLVFTNSGLTGQQHSHKGERLALEWLEQRARGGFREWDSNCYFEEDLLALAHLADLAESDSVWQMAAVVMDKMFFSIALNSFRGVFGSTHGRTYSPLIKGAHREATSGIGRLMWGMGEFNSRILGLVALACAKDYELPPVIAAIAADLPDAMWNLEQHAGVLTPQRDRAEGVWQVCKATFKTPDYMLCSAQDYHPGEKGYQQHIWQATLGPDAIVFVTHPPCCSEEGSHRPNFWHGNVVLPRVAQWQDVLLAVYRLPDDDWMGFTHAYFPTWAFDQWEIKEGWAFACRGEGYIALKASNEIQLAQRGSHVGRELRSYGQQAVWLCHMGRAALDGSFEAFQQSILGLDVRMEGLSARCQTLRGDTLEWGWQGAFRRNGQDVPLTGWKHYDNPYCVMELGAPQMDIVLGEQAIRLHFDE